ncbi:MAG TPA: cupin domain-containing protein [Phenylobacterium sp.]|uniref:cupin domain-containing protein n=1 Tax=Phenylobacterium sp. TaxID=1871053 RepID=UPI002B49E772|nr:cupin domain-containing protein [Phenylobacterium sp.]HKR87302.1 cupin domain-containing protein [Phenylobacterium sp.]
MPKIDVDQVPVRTGTNYPPPFDERCRRRMRQRLGDAAGLTQFGVNLLRLPPGQWSAQRHWHTAEDEFVYVLEGEGVLVSEAGEQTLRPGDCAGFPAGKADGHHIQNRSDRELVLLEVGSRCPEEDGCDYPDIDMLAPPGAQGYTRRDGTRY